MTIMVYSGEPVRSIRGRKGVTFANPALFTGPRRGAKAVYLNGDFPAVRSAYEALGVPVHDLRKMGRVPAPLPNPPARLRRRRNPKPAARPGNSPAE